ncbi:hypothetical protein LQ567_02315 [Niabella pedocola]|uniref:Uncharacterized protein n=1 Tax=Niabella pedocola TaxID=1752077 RepID=A0ABS8PKF2_9BACT|nr:hypothetical protein [Niabella pedocola]MCD2421578.1 hypothetical protein [Niabella pedocola]
MTQRKITTAALAAIFCIMLLGLSRSAQAQCTVCGNAYLNVTDNSSIEYDNIVSTFHSTLARQADGRVLAWGEDTKSNGTGNNLVPAEMNNANYAGLTGTILKFTGGSNAGSTNGHQVQFAVLTTDGLFVWGSQGKLISSSWTTSSSFAKVMTTAQLPVAPNQVKMLFGTYQTLVILSCTGDVYVLSQNGNMRGNGNGGDASTWARVEYSTATSSNNNTSAGNLGNIVAVRGAPGGLMALDANGDMWTWGDQVYLGTNTSGNNLNVGNGTRSRARKMTRTYSSNQFTPKMIGMTGTRSRSSHYALGTDGYVYSMGDNSEQQLGDRSSTERTSWVRVKSGSNTDLANIAWISPNEHDNYGNSAVNALTNTGNVWAWGNNERNMLGVSGGGNVNPTNVIGGLSGSDVMMAVETGGHTSMVVKKCSGRYGYVGHRINGSMADGTSNDQDEATYNFSATAVMDICGASSGATTLFPPQGSLHIGDQIQLVFTPAGGTFSVTGPATITQTGLLTITGNNAGIKVTYTATTDCGTTSSEVVIKAEDIFLPASFDKLSAAVKGNLLQVSFTTLTEQNNSHFEIEASKDGKAFVKIGDVASKALNGYSNMPLSYDFSLSQSAATGLLGISIAVLAFAGLLANRRNKWIFMLAVVMGAGLFGISSCKKQETPSVDASTKLFIRIKQVDKDGGYSYSKVIQAVQE